MLNTPVVRKRRTREHIIADLSVNYVERQALLRGHTVERTRHDYGYDLFLFLFNEQGEQEPGEIRIQLKASDAPHVLKSGQTISFSVSRSDLALWLFETMPVLLIFYDAQADQAYWLYIQQYFEQIAGFSLFTTPKTVSVRIPKANVLNQNAIRLFARFHAQAIA